MHFQSFSEVCLLQLISSSFLVFFSISFYLLFRSFFFGLCVTCPRRRDTTIWNFNSQFLSNLSWIVSLFFNSFIRSLLAHLHLYNEKTSLETRRQNIRILKSTLPHSSSTRVWICSQFWVSLHSVARWVRLLYFTGASSSTNPIHFLFSMSVENFFLSLVLSRLHSQPHHQKNRVVRMFIMWYSIIHITYI